MDFSFLKSCDDLNQLLYANFETGKIFWKARPESMFTSPVYFKKFNEEKADKECFLRISRIGYLYSNIDDMPYAAQYVIWCLKYGEYPKFQIYHIDGDIQNNKLNNLALSDLKFKGFFSKPLNLKKRDYDIKSKIEGINYLRSKRKWAVYGYKDGKRVILSTFSNKQFALDYKLKLFS